MSPEAIGHRAMAANLSDIAAMGARPVLATVALGLDPRTTAPDWVVACYLAMAGLAARFSAAIVGGDLVRAPTLTLSLTVVGEVSPRRMRLRDGARPYDVLAITGPTGASRAGLELLKRPLALDPPNAEAARNAFLFPEPRLREGRFLGASRAVHAMMDCTDGLSTDVARLVQAGGYGATLLGPPIDPAAEAVALAAGDDPAAYGLDGGEDFELIVAVAPRAFPHLARRFERHFGRPLIGFGSVDPEPGLRLAGPQGPLPLAPAGWDSLISPERPRAARG